MRGRLFFRNTRNILFKTAIIAISIIAVLPLIFIIGLIAYKGISAINLDFFVSGSKPTGETGGGILNALVGTGLLILIATLVATPIAVFTGMYLAEKRASRLASIVRWSVDLIQGVPSIVLGLIGYAWFVLPMAQLTGAKITFSILAGSLTLAMMMLPIIIKSTEETVRLIPYSLKESAIALGVPYYRTVLRVVLPASSSGIISGILLGIARISGETAPLLFTVFGNYYFNADILKPADSLPLLIFNYAMSPYEDLHTMAWGAALVLVAFILLLNILVRMVVRKWKIQF
ncbi:MAG: phosphate ABC transporter permease PstA [Spirochaetaceae bacterium]|nr:MAG: phosphate ABC transporter permease PstA [Spirochaetaceae bacterium]